MAHDTPCRIRLWRRSADEHVLLLVLHHIIADFWSLEVFVHELGLLYAATQTTVAAGDLPPASLLLEERQTLPPPGQPYTAYVHWQQQMLAGPDGARHQAYWQQQLAAPLPVLNLPTDRPRPPLQTWHGTAACQFLSATLTQALKTVSQAHDTTLYTTLLSAFYVLLYRYTGQADILVGSPMACRRQAAWSGVLGYFANPVVLRAQLTGTQSCSALIHQVRQTVLGAFEHQHYPFPWLVENLQVA
ncbi:MAG: non-ribosomal peptide synthetase, partial [Candidatus Tectomicrobia bacterium]|nr:non-ribosomal peptide synthetase [Candidatus Tectomicrobia bacterium]